MCFCAFDLKPSASSFHHPPCLWSRDTTLVVALVATVAATTLLATVLLLEHALVLVHGVTADSLAVEGVLGTWLDFAIDEGSGETGHQLLGFVVGGGLACGWWSGLVMRGLWSERELKVQERWGMSSLSLMG